MPTTFNDREQAFETKFARDEEFRFRVAARRDKLFAHWAADRMAMPADGSDTLVKSVLAIPDGPKHDQAVLQHVAEVLTAHGGKLSTVELSAALEGCAKEARQQLLDAASGRSEGH